MKIYCLVLERNIYEVLHQKFNFIVFKISMFESFYLVSFRVYFVSTKLHSKSHENRVLKDAWCAHCFVEFWTVVDESSNNWKKTEEFLVKLLWPNTFRFGHEGRGHAWYRLRRLLHAGVLWYQICFPAFLTNKQINTL